VPKARKFSDSTGSEESGAALGRRSFMRRASAGALAAGALATIPGLATPAHAQTGEMVDAGVGMYGNLTTASQISTFTIDHQRVTCGVGTLALDTSMVTSMLPLLGPVASSLPVVGGWTGPFAMLMYSLSIETFDVDRAGGMLRATGRMRSITNAAGVTIEDVEHDFLGTAHDGGDKHPDDFGVHFTTPFWKVGSNPMATPSTEVDGWSFFGGQLLLGAVIVGT
jgi:hypothetical protein